ncbi:MAG: YjjG family noncanonical pyrimidine nucleotidase [Candidatus Tenebribacter davisii]|jgi:YjjG family noncanonical pyrimidine nucleotidase|nr:YjjG family noncanonical pyrimidine nucleotidase [Candidatus Tenebribacter davisii]
MKYNLVLFDADGTLFDFDTAEREAFEKTFIQFGISENLKHLHKSYEIINNAIWKDFEQKKINSWELRTERFHRFFLQENLLFAPEVFSPIYLKNLSEGTHLLHGAKEIVSFLYGKCELALATNGLADVQNPRFANSELAKYFQYIFISEEIGHPKPNPEFFQHIFRKLPYKGSSIIIGDNLTSDIKGGNNFGIDTCWFNLNKCNNESGVIPTYEINDLDELRSILE